jgi:hypothetical protein
MKKQVFDKKEKSILELDKLFKGVGRDAEIANQKALKKAPKTRQNAEK